MIVSLTKILIKALEPLGPIFYLQVSAKIIFYTNDHVLSSFIIILTFIALLITSVVYHEGKEAVKGHYLTDVYHIGSSQWIRCDDSNLKAVPSPRIDNPEHSSRTPYLLFYRRLNTLKPPQSNNNSNNNVSNSQQQQQQQDNNKQNKKVHSSNNNNTNKTR